MALTKYKGWRNKKRDLICPLGTMIWFVTITSHSSGKDNALEKAPLLNCSRHGRQQKLNACGSVRKSSPCGWVQHRTVLQAPRDCQNWWVRQGKGREKGWYPYQLHQLIRTLLLGCKLTGVRIQGPQDAPPQSWVGHCVLSWGSGCTH